MSMSKTVLGQLLQTKMKAVPPRGAHESFDDYQLRVFTAMADAIVSHIKDHAEVTSYVAATDAGLQTYTVPPAAAVPTTGNPALVAPRALSTKGTVA